MRCVIFGHAVYEKALTPYLGMTAHCVLLAVEDTLFEKPWPLQLVYIDLAAMISSFQTAFPEAGR